VSKSTSQAANPSAVLIDTRCDGHVLFIEMKRQAERNAINRAILPLAPARRLRSNPINGIKEMRVELRPA
jgi:hypothetical protein